MDSDMTAVRAAGKASPARHPYGPRAVGALLPAVTRPAFRAMPAGVAQIMADWPAIVGANLARSTQPRRFAAGTLTLGCAGPVALELQHMAGPLMERINGHIGRPMVQRLRFVQQAFAPSAAFTTRVRATPERRVIAGLPAGKLHDALAGLAAAMDAAPRDERA